MLKNAENIAWQNLPFLYTFVLRAEIRTTFTPIVVRISACNTKVYKIGKFCQAIFSVFFNISQPNFAILLFLMCSFQLHNKHLMELPDSLTVEVRFWFKKIKHFFVCFIHFQCFLNSLYFQALVDCKNVHLPILHRSTVAC